MKKLLLTVIFVFSLAFVVSAEEAISLDIDGKAIQCDTPPRIIDGRTMVPVRAIFEGVGAVVDWNSDTKEITGKLGSLNVIMSIDSNTALVNGSPVQMDCAPVIIDGRTLAPARYVAESFGCKVNWDSEKRAVSISTPLAEKNSPAERPMAEKVTENSTEATTAAETTTHPMYAYKTYYKPGTYEVGKDMPAGEYVVFANPDSIGYLYKYAKDGTTTARSGKRYLYSNYFSYNDVITLSDKNYLDLSSAYAVPSEDVSLLDLSKNGTFRAGKDISLGHITFKKSPETPIAYVDAGYISDPEAQRTISYLTEDNGDSVVANIRGGMLVRTFGCDIYNANLSLIKTYEPVSSNNKNTDKSLKLSDVSPSFKNEVDSYLATLVNDMKPGSLNSEKYSSSYQKQINAGWTSKAANSAEKKYAALANNFYTHLRDCAQNTKGSLASSPAVRIRGKNISSAQFKNLLNSQKDYFVSAEKYFVNGKSFEDLEVAVSRMSQYRHDVPRFTGDPAREEDL